MYFNVDNRRFRKMSIHAMTVTSHGRFGITIVILVVVAAFILNIFFHTQSDGYLARSMHARDAESMGALGIVFFAMVLTVALGVLYATWRKCNENIGARLNQSVQIEGGWLQYSYKPLENYRTDSVVVVFIPLRKVLITYDDSLGLIKMRGLAFSKLCMNSNLEWPRSLNEMNKCDTFIIPNCFTPDLYQTLLSRRK